MMTTAQSSIPTSADFHALCTSEGMVSVYPDFHDSYRDPGVVTWIGRNPMGSIQEWCDIEIDVTFTKVVVGPWTQYFSDVSLATISLDDIRRAVERQPLRKTTEPHLFVTYQVIRAASPVRIGDSRLGKPGSTTLAVGLAKVMAADGTVTVYDPRPVWRRVCVLQ